MFQVSFSGISRFTRVKKLRISFYEMLGTVDYWLIHVNDPHPLSESGLTSLNCQLNRVLHVLWQTTDKSWPCQNNSWIPEKAADSNESDCWLCVKSITLISFHAPVFGRFMVNVRIVGLHILFCVAQKVYSFLTARMWTQYELADWHSKLRFWSYQ